jgi:hypothetical protein
VIGSDAVALTGGTATFGTKNVANDKTVTLSGAALSGSHAGNYSLTSVGTTTADVTPLAITGSFAAANKTYDGTTDATVLTRSPNGVLGSDGVTLTGGTASFADKNIGTAKVVTLAGAALSGADKDNYTLSSVGTTTANIVAKQLTVTASSPATLVVGAPVPTITPSYSGFVPGEGAGLVSGMTCGTTYTTASTVGTYPSTCSNASAPNYSMSYVAGSVRVEYGWNGYLQPINDTAHTGLYESKFKLGQTIPVKFDLTNAAGQIVQQAVNPKFTKSTRLGNCDNALTVETLPTLAADGDVYFNYTGGHYQYNWSTKNVTQGAGEYRIFANLADGTQRSVDICLTK